MNRRYDLPWILLAFLAALLLLLIAFASWRSSGTGPQVQVPMFYDAHYLFPRPWTQEQAAPGIPDAAPLALYGDNSASQTFTAGADNLSQISLFLSGPESAIVQAVLSGAHGRAWETAVVLAPDGGRDRYAISIPAQESSKGERYTLRLSAPEATADEPVIVESTAGDRLDGALRLNEFVRPGNLAITTYSRGVPGFWWLDAIGEQLLPSLFRLRLQQYKPPPFKGALFSWLLLLTAGLSAALLVLAKPDREYGSQVSASGLARFLGWFLFLVLGAFLIWQVGDGRVRILPGANSFEAASMPDAAIGGVGAQPRLIADLSSDLWTAEREPEARFISTDIVHSLPALRAPGDSAVRYALTVPPDSRLRFAPAAEGRGEISFGVQVNDVSLFDSQEIASEDRPLEALEWREVDLGPWSGQGVLLSLTTSSDSEDVSGMWLMPQIVTEASWLLNDLPAHVNTFPVNARYDGAVELLAVASLAEEISTAEEAAVKLYWRPLKPTERTAKVFVHLYDSADRLVAQHDGQPVGGAYPFTIWPPGGIIEDEHVLRLDQDKGSGPYRLVIGIYDAESLARWPAASANGASLEHDQAVVELESP